MINIPFRFFFISLGSLFFALGGTMVKAEPEQWEVFAQRGDYTAALEASQGLSDGYRQQVQAWLYAILGSENKAFISFCPSVEECVSNVGGTDELKDAATVGATISELSGQYDFFFLNEAHHISKHRAFAKSLLRGLQQKGYTHFAIEALDVNSLKRLENGLLPDLMAPIYLHDPEFRDLLKTAQELGFKFFQYELDKKQIEKCNSLERISRINCREERLAANLLQKIGPQNTAKTLVYHGFDHGKKCTVALSADQNIDWMAKWIKHLTGARVLSVDQVTTFFMVPDDAKISSPIIFSADSKDGDDLCYDFIIRHAIPDGKGSWASDWK